LLLYFAAMIEHRGHIFRFGINLKEKWETQKISIKYIYYIQLTVELIFLSITSN